MQNTNTQSVAVKTQGNGGALLSNRNETVAVKTRITGGGLVVGTFNHNEAVAVKTRVSAGFSLSSGGDAR